jgi:hypothetical protein
MATMANPNPIDAGIIGNLKQPAQTSLGDMLNIARGAQAYQQQQQINPLELEKAQLEVNLAKARNPEFVEQSKEATKQAKIGTIEKQFGLDQKQYQAASEGVSALAVDPDIRAGKDKSAITRKLALQRQRLIDSGVPADKVEPIIAHLITAAQSNPESVMNHVGTIRNMFIPASTQQANVMGQQTVQGTDLSGNPTVTVKSPITGQMEQQPLPAANNMRIGETETPTTVAQLQDTRTKAAQAAQSVGPGLQRINEAVNAADEMIQGKLGGTAAKFNSYTGGAFGIGQDAATARAVLVKDLAGASAYLQQMMPSGGTVAALTNAQHTLADPDATPEAIKRSLLSVKPLMLHTRNLNEGFDNVAKLHGNDFRAQRAYLTKMGNAYDPDVILALEADKQGELAKFMKNLSPKEREKIMKKGDEYENLISGKL